jgi:hypothetical protein
VVRGASGQATMTEASDWFRTRRQSRTLSLSHYALSLKVSEGDCMKRKGNLLRWLLWWRIDQDELNKQVAEYESMRRIQTAKGMSFFLLILSACATTTFIVFGDLSTVDFSEVLIALVLGYFIYRGHRWATIAAMVFWSIERLTAIWGKPVFSPPFYNPVEMTVVQLVWWSIYMHVFYLAFRVEGLRRGRESK